MKLLFSPNDSSGTGTAIEDNKMSHEDMVDFIGQEDGEKEDAETIELEESEGDRKGDKETREETKEEDEQEEEPEVDEEEIVVPVRRKEILAKYPNIFKDFPHLDRAVYREQQYSEILPTLEDAKNAAKKSELLDRVNGDLEAGDTRNLLRAVKQANQETFANLVDNYLPQLRSVDENAYYHVLSNVIKHTILAMANSSDSDTKQAAQVLNQFVFQSDKFTPPFNLSQESGPKSQREQAQEQREIEFRREVLDTHVESVNTRVDNAIKATIDKNIDPRESMNAYTRKQAMRDCQEELDGEIDKDTRFRNLLDKLWEQSAEQGFSQPSLDRIKSAYLSKAKTLLPQIIKKIRSEALRTKRSVDIDDEPRRGPLPVGQTRKSTPNQARPTSTGNDKEKAKAIPKGMRSIDYLMRD